jgi:NAD-dependent SIR2 family protein deacetylase
MPKYVTPPIGSSRKIRVEYMKALGQAWSEKRLVLFLGAGVSLDYGIPQWDNLVYNLLTDSKYLGDYWQHYQMALISRLATSFDFSPTTLARVVKYKLRDQKSRHMDDARVEKAMQRVFKEKVRRQLYLNYKTPQKATTLTAVADLIDKSEQEGRRIQAVLTTNFDDLLETELAKKGVGRRKINVHPICDATRRMGQGLPVIHVHGSIPRRGPIPQSAIVFTEDDYHRLTYSPFHWALGEITGYLRNYTVLFVGVSMADPNLRRLLDATFVRERARPGHRSNKLYHYILRKEYSMTDEQRENTIDAIIEDAERFGEEYGLPDKKKERQVVAGAVTAMLKQAHTYDRELFKDMGLGTIWVESYDDYPAVLERIPQFAA